MFVHLQVHSAYSLLYGPRRIEEIVRAAADSGFPALALTDINNLYGVHVFLRACGARGIRPVIGAEIRRGEERAVLLCRDRAGYENLCRIITRRMRDPSFRLAGALGEAEEGLTVLTDSPAVLEAAAGRVRHLYGLVTPFSRLILPAADRLGLPVAAAGDVTFLEAGDYRIHRVLRAVALRKSVGGVPPEELAPERALLFSAARAGDIFRETPGAIAAAGEIAESCGFRTIFRGFVFPACPPSLLRDGEGPAEALRRLAREGASRRYGRVDGRVRERIEYELGIIIAKGFADYFLVVADIVGKTSRTCGRGSAAASVVSYCLGITNVDPLAHDLYFERFLNPERTDPPDIDVDFPWDERDAVVAEVMRSYGEDCSARICNHNHFQQRGALRETARAYGIPDGETGAFEKRLRRDSEAEKDAVWSEILLVARRIEGLPRHLGVHSGGLVLTPRPLASYVPVEDATKGVPVVTWEKDGTEDAGLVKIDLLGNRSLAVIRDALASLRENGSPLDEDAWRPQEDPDTRNLLARGDSIGVFYIESPAMRQLQKKTRTGDFAHIVIHSSIIRPAANAYINEYVRRLKGGSWEPLHPLLDPLLRETYGIMCYQEDILKAAVAVAGFSHGEADGLRKILSKKNREERLGEYRRKFFSGALSRGVDGARTEKIWNMILSFAGYSFCKPHSASYAMVSFQSAYLKAHHPAEFMAAVLSNGGGYYTAAAYASEAKRMGLRVLPPSVNESRYRYSGRPGEVRVGLMAVAGLRRETAENIVRERASGGPYPSAEDLASRAALVEGDAEALAESGALDCLALAGPGGRAERLWALLRASGAVPAGGQGLLFRPPPAEVRRFRPRGDRRTKEAEYRRLGFLPASHPLVFSAEEAGRFPHIDGRDLESCVGRRVGMIGLLVTVKEIITIAGKPMEFVSFEDETAIFETVFFPESYGRYAPLLEEGGAFALSGRVADELGAVSLQVETLAILRGSR